jgi:hypothetical protein
MFESMLVLHTLLTCMNCVSSETVFSWKLAMFQHFILAIQRVEAFEED